MKITGLIGLALCCIISEMAFATMQEDVIIPGDAYTGYEGIPAEGSDLILTISPAANYAINWSGIVPGSHLDDVPWQRAQQPGHVYQVGTVLSSREWLWVTGAYHQITGGGGGSSPLPKFNVKVAAVSVDVDAVPEDQEETVGAWIPVGGARKMVSISAVQQRGPGNWQYLTWPSAKVSLWTAATGGNMLSGNSTNLSADQGYTYYAQGETASGSVRDSEILLSYANVDGTAQDKVKLTVLKIDLSATDLDGTVADATEETTGAYVHWNLDNDDASDNTVGAPKHSGGDYLQTGVAQVTGENDLKSLAMSLQPDLSQGTVVLNIDNAKGKVWKAQTKGSTNLVLAGSGDKTWDLANSSQKTDFQTLCSSLWVEGNDAGTCNVKLAYKDTSGAEICSDTVKYTFIATDCGRQPKTDSPDERTMYKNAFPNLVHCEWSITDEATPNYNCIAWSVGETGNWYVDIAANKIHPTDIAIDDVWGNGDGTMTTAELDAFYDAKGYVPTGTGAADSDVMYYSGFHGARKKGCSCGAGKWIIFESKCGEEVRMEHVFDQLNGTSYGQPVRFYKHE